MKPVCNESVRGECAERMDALEQRLERVEGMEEVLRSIEKDVSYMRGRFDALAATPPPAQLVRKPHRAKQIAVNLGLGTGIVAAFEFVKSLISH